MKRLAIFLIAALSGIFCATATVAGGSTTIGVQATILGTCAVESSPGLMDFGSINPQTFSTRTISGMVNLACTQEESYSINFAGVVTPEGGSAIVRKMDDGAGNVLPYTVKTLSDPTGFGEGGKTEVGFDFRVELLASDVQQAVTGTYQDTFTFVISP